MLKYFYRVHVKLNDHESKAHLSFDFNDKHQAMLIAETLFLSCDILSVWVEILDNEVNTTNSPMWREYK